MNELKKYTIIAGTIAYVGLSPLLVPQLPQIQQESITLELKNVPEGPWRNPEPENYRLAPTTVTSSSDVTSGFEMFQLAGLNLLEPI